jgi:hypothetical protein
LALVMPASYLFIICNFSSKLITLRFLLIAVDLFLLSFFVGVNKKRNKHPHVLQAKADRYW